MSEDVKRDRSPNHPKLSLEQTMALIEELYKKAGKTKIKREVAINALGYSGPSGASLTTLGALAGYGLLEGGRGENISVSPLAIRLIRPTNNDQAIEARREAALKPRVFYDLFSSGCHLMDEDVLSNHLIQNGFTSDSAKRAASVFKANVSFAKLNDEGILSPEQQQEMPKSSKDKSGKSPLPIPPVPQPPQPPHRKVLVDYSIPLGANEAHITITGERLTSDDFAALRSYVDLFQQQYSRSFGLERITGSIATQPQMDGSRIKFLLALPGGGVGGVVSCMSGAGTKFPPTDFVNGQKITLLGEQKADLLIGRTPFFVFSEYEKLTEV